jgi:hypothetical protein
MSKKNASFTYNDLFNDKSLSVGCYIRTQDESNSSDDIYYIRKSHIISPRDEFIDLSVEDYSKALKLTEENWLKKGKTDRPNYPNGEIVRNDIRDPKNPLLLIYLLDPEGAKIPELIMPFIGYAVSFPKSRFSEFVSYRINENLLDKFDFDDNVIENYDDED